MRQATIINKSSARSPEHRRQLQGFDLAAVFQDVEEHLDFPEAAIPVHKFRGFGLGLVVLRPDQPVGGTPQRMRPLQPTIA